jgi:hypothetical protein
MLGAMSPAVLRRATWIVAGLLCASLAALAVVGGFGTAVASAGSAGYVRSHCRASSERCQHGTGHIDLSKVPDYVPDLNQQGAIAGYTPKQDLFPVTVVAVGTGEGTRRLTSLPRRLTWPQRTSR